MFLLMKWGLSQQHADNQWKDEVKKKGEDEDVDNSDVKHLSRL